MYIIMKTPNQPTPSIANALLFKSAMTTSQPYRRRNPSKT